MKKQIQNLIMAAAVSAALSPALVRAENIRIAFIDPLTGPFTPVGQNVLKSFEMIADMANKQKWAGNNTIEFVGFDNKGSPQESLSQLKSAIDQGYRYVTQGAGSGVALGLLDAINKHNDRNPGKEIVLLNWGSIDPDLTNRKCSFWYFRFDANTDMKIEALAAYMAENLSIKKSYIIGQNYAAGHQFSRAAKEYITRKRPDIQLVGDDLHPIGVVKDFSPYIAKMKAAGADNVLTQNWGQDLALLIRAAKDADFKANFYTFYAASPGVPTAMGAAGADRVKFIANWNQNNEGFVGKDLIDTFKKKHNGDFVVIATYTIVSMLSKAVKQAQSADPVKVAFTLENMKAKSLNGDVEMRKSDHQLQQPMYIATWVKTNGKDVKIDQENTGYGWKTEKKFDAFVGTQPTSCEMKRSAK